MSEPSSQAKQARETLARALGALQSDPSVPPALSSVAEPVSQAMGTLFQIERSGSLATAGAARDHVRAALGQLQADTSGHPAVAIAMEAVAGSLGLVFGLVKLAEAAPTAVAQALPAATAPTAYQQAPAYQAPPQQAPAYQAPPQPQAAYQPPPQPQAAYQPPPQQAPAYQPPPQPQAAYQPPPQPQAAYQPPPQQAPAYQAPPQPAPAYQAPPQAPAAPDGELPKFEASLGISSPSNFYKGLAGNDVVDHGGLFVSTYAKLPKVGADVSLKVILPGGYEFDSIAKIQWIRESGGDSTPGFGARFVQISAESRQLVYRYVKNREPIFHDDL